MMYGEREQKEGGEMRERKEKGELKVPLGGRGKYVGGDLMLLLLILLS